MTLNLDLGRIELPTLWLQSRNCCAVRRTPYENRRN
jgi:hypothetical protein